MGLIIAGFPCIGKTTLAKDKTLNIIDLESTRYKYLLQENKSDLEKIKLNVGEPLNSQWPSNYIEAIIEAEKYYDIVFVLGKYDFNKIMIKKGIKFCVAYPDPNENQKEEYLKRAIYRGNPESFIEIFFNNYEKWQKEFELLDVPHIKLKRGEYIGDALARLNILNGCKSKNNLLDEELER